MKMFRRALLYAFLLVVACVAAGCSVYREPAALLPGIGFGMSPAEVQTMLGEPDEVEEFTAVNDVTYTWLTYGECMVEGHPARLRLKFLPFRRGLVLEQYTVTFPGEDRAALMTEIDAALAAQLTDDMGFTRRERPDNMSYECSHGPVGTYYQLSVWEGNVCLLGECTEYNR